MEVLDRLLAEAPHSYIKRINKKNGGRVWEICISTSSGKETWLFLSFSI